jgi:dTDP-4-dehydrorhamnose reductase
MRILLTGAGGQLGRAVQVACAAHDLIPLTHTRLDVSIEADVHKAFDAHRPEVVIHCAALTNTTLCENDTSAAQRANADGTSHVAAASARHGAALFAISTNEVFDGLKRTPYLETDDPHPVNAYGASKLEAETRAREADPTVRIVRTSWLYGDGSGNFVAKVLAAARDKRRLTMVSDEVATPTSCEGLAQAIAALIEHQAPPGVFHLVNEGEASRYEWAREILRLAGITDVCVEDVTMDEFRSIGFDGPRKPPYSTLANTNARSIGIVLRPWDDALAKYIRRLKAKHLG